MARRGPRALRKTLYGTHQWMEADGRLHRSDLGRLRGDDQVARQRELESATDTNPLDAGHNRGGVFVERAEHIDEMPIQDVGGVSRFDHRVEIGTRREMAQRAAQDHRSRLLAARPVQALDDVQAELDVQQVVGLGLHGQHRDRTVHGGAYGGVVAIGVFVGSDTLSDSFR